MKGHFIQQRIQDLEIEAGTASYKVLPKEKLKACGLQESQEFPIPDVNGVCLND